MRRILFTRAKGCPSLKAYYSASPREWQTYRPSLHLDVHTRGGDAADQKRASCPAGSNAPRILSQVVLSGKALRTVIAVPARGTAAPVAVVSVYFGNIEILMHLV